MMKNKAVDLGALQDRLTLARRQKSKTTRALARAQEADLSAAEELTSATNELASAYHGVRNS